MLAAYLGEERLCTLVYDMPRDLERLADRFADLYIGIAERDLQQRRPWKGGYVSSWGVYAPGPLLDYQIDASSLFSLETYQRHFAVFDAKVLSKFPYTLIHLHNCGLHILEAVLAMKGVHAVEISLDREAVTWKPEAILNRCRLIQEHGKALLLSGELAPAERDEFLRTLRPGGLAIFYWKPRAA